jgi:DNA-binding PadR family transcriptional regulator
MRRKQGSLIPLEVAILEAAADLQATGQPEANGYLLGRLVRDARHARRLTAYGTLYKALTMLEGEGYLASRWEDPMVAAGEGRPRRRFYRLTLEGEGALAEAHEIAREVRNQRPAAATVQ